jgi:hypothetical protein
MEAFLQLEEAGVGLATRRIVTVIKALLYAMQLAKLRTKTVAYDISVGYVRTFYKNGFSLMYDIDGIAIVDEGRDVTRSEQALIKEAFEELRVWEQQQQDIMVTQDSPHTNAWDLFQRLIFACEAARKLHIGSDVETDPKSRRSAEQNPSYVRRLDRNMDSAQRTFMRAAYRAFCDRDVSILEKMLEQMKRLWDNYFVVGDGKLINGVRDMLERPTECAINTVELDRMNTMIRPERLPWPAAPKPIDIPPELTGESIDGVHKQFDIGGAKVLRMIAPSMV